MIIEQWRGMTPSWQEPCYMASTAVLAGNVRIGKKSSVWHHAALRADDNEVIDIGDYVNIQEGSVLHVDHGFGIHIGNYVTIGHKAIVHGCTIEDNCLIGMGAIIMNGAVIGSGSIIGAGALITQGKVIPPNSLVMGAPGKVVRSLSPEEVAQSVQHAAQYWQYALEFMK